MTVLTLTAAEALAVHKGARTSFDQMVEAMAPTPGPLREAIRYELAWAMKRIATEVIDRLATEVPPQTDSKTPPRYWVSLSAELRASRTPEDFDDLDTLPGFAHGTPTAPPPPIDPDTECDR